MALAAGEKVPDFKLQSASADEFGGQDLQGRTIVFVFYPFAFSPVCTDQLQIYEGALADFAAKGVELFGVSCDSTYAQSAFVEKLGRGHFYVDAKDLVVTKWAVTSSGDSSTLELVLPASAAVWKGQVNFIFAYASSPDFTSRHKARGSATLTIN